MIWIRGSGVVGLVAGVAIRWSPRIHTTDVAKVAGDSHVRPLQRERRVVVVERRIQPRRGGMAHGAVLRESTCHVIRDTGHRGGVVVILQMATDAGGWQSSRVIVGVASGAWHIHVRASQRKSRCAVIESGVEPVHSCMAYGAVLREIRSHVIGHASNGRCTVVILCVTAVASGRCVRVIPADVALRALQIGVAVRQREKLVVIEIRGIPPRSRVASSAGRSRKTCLSVRRIVRGVVGGQMARSTIG